MQANAAAVTSVGAERVVRPADATAPTVLLLAHGRGLQASAVGGQPSNPAEGLHIGVGDPLSLVAIASDEGWGLAWLKITLEGASFEDPSHTARPNEIEVRADPRRPTRMLVASGQLSPLTLGWSAVVHAEARDLAGNHSAIANLKLECDFAYPLLSFGAVPDMEPEVWRPPAFSGVELRAHVDHCTRLEFSPPISRWSDEWGQTVQVSDLNLDGTPRTVAGTVTPSSTTVYTATATGPEPFTGTVRKSTKVFVNCPPPRLDPPTWEMESAHVVRGEIRAYWTTRIEIRRRDNNTLVRERDFPEFGYSHEATSFQLSGVTGPTDLRVVATGNLDADPLPEPYQVQWDFTVDPTRG